jgi:prophage DNA circulation protein
MVTYTFGLRMPSLWIAQRLYADPTRAQEIIDENKIVHPAFCLTTIRALSA